MSSDRYSGRGGNYQAPKSMHDLRSYSTSYASTTNDFGYGIDAKEVKIKGGNGALSSKSWSFNDPELRRKKRVAGYKANDVEGKMKGSFRKSFRWIKDTCNQVVYGGKW